MRFSEDRLATLDCGPQAKRQIHIWEPAAPRAVILALHGGMAHAGDYVTPALYFRERGFATAAAREVDGIPLPAGTVTRLAKLAERLGVSPPQPRAGP